MKSFYLFIFIGFQLSGFSQSLKKRDRITANFEKSKDIKIELFNMESVPKQADSIQISSNYLKRKNIQCRILAFRISGIDKNAKVIFSVKSFTNKVPQEFRTKLKACLNCTAVQVDSISINWFTGTYTLREKQRWSLQ